MKYGFIALLLLIGMAAQTQAQSVFRWTDDEGRIHYGHAVPPEYRSRGFERLAPDGRVLESVAPEMTPEERAEALQRRALQAELQAEQDSQAARDRLLLAAYRSEQDIIDARTMRLDAMSQQRRALETSHRHAVQRFEDLIGRAATLARQSQIVPEALESAIAETQDELRRLREAVREMDERLAAIEERFEHDLERYRALTHSSD